MSITVSAADELQRARDDAIAAIDAALAKAPAAEADAIQTLMALRAAISAATFAAILALPEAREAARAVAAEASRMKQVATHMTTAAQWLSFINSLLALANHVWKDIE